MYFLELAKNRYSCRAYILMGHLASYFDYEAYARDLFIDDFYFSNGYVFRR